MTYLPSRRSLVAAVLSMMCLVGATAVAASAEPSPTPSGPLTTPTRSTPTTTVPSTSDPTTTPTPGVVFSAGFEDGRTDGFTGLPATVGVTTTSPGRLDSRALLVGPMTGYGQGTAVTLPAGLPTGWYGAYANVRLPSGQSQDFRLSLAGAASTVYGVTRATGNWVQTATYFSLDPSTTATLTLTPVAFCSDAPAAPLPFTVDDVVVRYFGTVPPPVPFPPNPTCPLNPGSSTSPSTTPPVGCQFSNTITPWDGGYQSSISLTNLTDAPITGWTLRLTLPPGDKVIALWPATFSQSGTTLTVTNPSWNPTLAPGRPTSLGFVASRTGSGPVGFPTGVTLNGSPCRYPVV